MNINNEEQARSLIEQWQTDPPMAQRKNLRLALESLELSQMYYEQKGNAQGESRVIACIAIVNQRIQDLEKA